MTKITDHKYTIHEAFSQCFYIVPDYQREYVWSEKEVTKLLEDINEQVADKNSNEYFVGTILVSPASELNQYEVIDGQQRLTTFFLLLCALRNRFKNQPQHSVISALLAASQPNIDGSVQTSLKLEPRYEHAADLIKAIVSLDADPQTTRAQVSASGIPRFGSLENLLGAYATIDQYLSDNYDDTTKLLQYWGYLATKVVFIQISTDVSSALKIFETINERGIGLNSMDLLKNLLFRHVEPRQFTQLKDEWKKVTAPLEQTKEKPLRFLRYFLMASYNIKNERRDGVIREDEIYDWLTKKENKALCGYEDRPFEFVRKIIRNVNLFIGFTKGLASDGQPSLAMDSMQQLCGPAFSLHYILLLAANPLPRSLFEQFVNQLESFLFYYIFTKTPTKDLERNFSVWADELREIAAIPDIKIQAARLNSFVATKFQQNMTSKESELADSLRRYRLGAMQFYRTRYLLAKLTQFVEMAFKGMKAPGPLRDYTTLEVEHILPDTPEDDLLTAFAATNPGKKYDDYKVKLGNLTLLEKPINIVASNDFFEKKKGEYIKSGNYLTRSIVALSTVGMNSSINRINERLKCFENWTGSDIDNRQDELIGLAKEVWKTNPIEA